MTSPTHLNRALGTILGLAVGDALGAPYEFQHSQHITLTGTAADMCGGGGLNWEPGEWTDDTSMAIPILRELAAGADPLDATTQDRVVTVWRDWAADAPDVGIQTRRVLSELTEPTASAARASARRVHEATGRSAGNGSLMRTAPLALAYLSEREGASKTADAARTFSDLTHFEPDAGDACVIWTLAIREAILSGTANMDDAVGHLPAERQERWHGLLAEAESKQPGDFPNNGWVVHALQAAWSAMYHAGLNVSDPSTHTPEAFRGALELAINAGNDTDTVAAITGQLAGALVGADAIPDDWKRMAHGWPGLEAAELAHLTQGACDHTAAVPEELQIALRLLASRGRIKRKRRE